MAAGSNAHTRIRDALHLNGLENGQRLVGREHLRNAADGYGNEEGDAQRSRDKQIDGELQRDKSVLGIGRQVAIFVGESRNIISGAYKHNETTQSTVFFLQLPGCS